jgi:hypothetical protein
VELKRLSKQFLSAKKSAQKSFLISILKNEGKCCIEFYKYAKRRKGNREDIAMDKDCNEQLITDSIEKALKMSIILQYSALNAESCKYSVLTHANPLPLVLK